MATTIEEIAERFRSNAEYMRTHGGLQKCLEFNQIAEWLEQLQKIQKIMAKRPKDMISSNPTLRAISEVLEDENDNR